MRATYDLKYFIIISYKNFSIYENDGINLIQKYSEYDSYNYNICFLDISLYNDI